MSQKQSMNTQEISKYNAFYLESDKKRARIGLLILIFPIVVFSINDFAIYGLTQFFYGLSALRGCLLICTIIWFIYLPRMEHYSTYEGLMALWTFGAAASILLINFTRPPAYLPIQVTITILFTLLAFTILPNRLRYQTLSAAIVTSGEIGIILFYANGLAANVITSGLAGLILAFTVGFVSSWQLERYRKENFAAHEQLRLSRDFSEAKYQQIVEKLPEMVVELDNRGKVIFANQRALELTGYTKEELQSNFDANNLVAPEDLERSRANMKKMFAGGMRHSNEYTFIRKDGKRFPVLSTSVAVRDENGNIVGARGIISDLTERKVMEKQLKDSERLAAIGQTAGMVGHDIRNPLQAIVAELYLARKNMSQMPEGNERQEGLNSVAFVEDQVDYINKIVSDLQDYARPLNPEYSIVDLSSLLNSVFDTIALPDTIKLKVELGDNLTLKTDPTFVKRAVTNLVNNAVQAMPDGGELGVSVEKSTDCVAVCVSDTGVGIPDNVKASLFKPLTTTKAKGQGLGLAVVKRLVEGLNGNVRFESEQGKGTKFFIELPEPGQNHVF
jgi:PAS domain S-box-containing protein